MAKAAEEYAVLVVEDDPAIRRLVTMILKRAGYTIEVASDGVEAVLKLGLADYDAIILDLMMPNLDGFAFIAALALTDPPRLRKIIVTSAASPNVIRDRLVTAPFAVLPKPFDIKFLVECVRACITAQELT